MEEKIKQLARIFAEYKIYPKSCYGDHSPVGVFQKMCWKIRRTRCKSCQLSVNGTQHRSGLWCLICSIYLKNPYAACISRVLNPNVPQKT